MAAVNKQLTWKRIEPGWYAAFTGRRCKRSTYTAMQIVGCWRLRRGHDYVCDESTLRDCKEAAELDHERRTWTARQAAADQSFAALEDAVNRGDDPAADLAMADYLLETDHPRAEAYLAALAADRRPMRRDSNWPNAPHRPEHYWSCTFLGQTHLMAHDLPSEQFKALRGAFDDPVGVWTATYPTRLDALLALGEVLLTLRS